MKKRKVYREGEREQSCRYVSGCVCIRSPVRNRKQEAERASQNQECQENKSSGAEERTKDACKPPKTAPLSPL